MTSKEKQLLLKDICARAPYGLKVKCEKYPFPVTVLYAGNIDEVKFEETGGIESVYAIKPYLRPMSSMTEEEKKEFLNLADGDDDDFEDIVNYPNVFGLTVSIETFDWLNAHQFDYRGLIEKGLALEAPEGMYIRK